MTYHTEIYHTGTRLRTEILRSSGEVLGRELFWTPDLRPTESNGVSFDSGSLCSSERDSVLGDTLNTPSHLLLVHSG